MSERSPDRLEFLDPRQKMGTGVFSREQTAEQQFWHLWRQGQRPNLSTFLSQRALSPPQVAAVVAVDQYERWLAGERVQAEDYLALLPSGPEADQAACDVVYGEYLLREQLGERPSLDEYQQRFPAQATLLARQVELHHALASEEPEAPDSVPRNTTYSGRAKAVLPAGPLAIPGYEIQEEIGRGGMGVVYKARQLSLDRLVALKVLDVQSGREGNRDLAGAEHRLGALDRMQREAKVMARMRHPHIVAVYDAGQAGSHFYFAMEYVAGTDLHRLVEQGGPLPIEQASEYMRQAALGLQHAHEMGLVHRDIKPSNLIVTSSGTGQNGAGSQLKILDLGLARLVQPIAQVSPATPITQVGAFMGTPDFVAPEQANDPRVADIRSDLYSLGCTFYYVLTGRVPFAGATPLAKLMKHHLEDPPPLEELRPGIPQALSALIRKLMAKRPEERFASPADLARALARLQGAPSLPESGPAPEHRQALPVGVRPEKSPPPSSRSLGGAGQRTGTPGLVRRLTGHSDWIKCVACSPDGRMIASGGLDRSVRLWQEGVAEAVWRVEGHASAVLCLMFSPDGRSLVTGGQDRVLCSWDLETRQERWRATGHTDNINAIAFSADGTRLISASHDGTLRLWDGDTGRPIRAWSAHDVPVWGVAITADGRQALSGGQDRMIRLWDVERGESLLALPEQAMPVTCVALTADGRRALSGGMDGLVRLWDLSRQREVYAFEGHTGRVTSVAFSPDGSRVASGSRDRTVRVQETNSGRELCAFNGHTHWVTAIAWSPDATRVVSGSVDRSVCVWAVPLG